MSAKRSIKLVTLLSPGTPPISYEEYCLLIAPDGSREIELFGETSDGRPGRYDGGGSTFFGLGEFMSSEGLINSPEECEKMPHLEVITKIQGHFATGRKLTEGWRLEINEAAAGKVQQ